MVLHRVHLRPLGSDDGDIIWWSEGVAVVPGFLPHGPSSTGPVPLVLILVALVLPLLHWVCLQLASCTWSASDWLMARASAVLWPSFPLPFFHLPPPLPYFLKPGSVFGRSLLPPLWLLTSLLHFSLLHCWSEAHLGLAICYCPLSCLDT